jgi:hypothetical protein
MEKVCAMPETITAIEMAKSPGIDPKAFRAALRKQKFSWHIATHHWTVAKDGPEHDDMRQVLKNLMEHN